MPVFPAGALLVAVGKVQPARFLCPHRPRDTSVTCTKTSVMATTSSPCWRSSRGTAWCVRPPTCPFWSPACLSPRYPCLPSFLPWGLSHVPRPCPARPRPLLCLPAWERPRSLCRGFTAPLVSVSEPRPITSRSALLRFLCCLDCEPWPLPFTLCPALAGQPRERDVIRSSRLVSGRACWLRQRMGSPRLGAQLTWGWWPVWPDLCLALGGADGCASSCLVSCLLHCPGPGLGPTVGGGLPPPAGRGREDASLCATALHPRLPGYCLLPPLPSFPQPGPGLPFPAGEGARGRGKGCCPTGEDLGAVTTDAWGCRGQMGAVAGSVGADRPRLFPQPREKGRMRFHKLQNVQIALDYLRHRQVRLPTRPLAAVPLPRRPVVRCD